MNIIVGLLIAGIIIAIVFLSRGSQDKEEAREKYLKDLEDFLGGKKEPLAAYEDSFRISFKHEGLQFVFEDVKEEGLGESVFYRAYLRVKTPFSLSLTFVERSKSAVFLHRERNVLSTPKKLKEFMVLTNKPREINKFLGRDDVVKTLAKFKNIDSRGHPIMSWEINDGTLILKFHDIEEGLTPNISTLQDGVTSIEYYLDKMLVILKALEEVEEDAK